MDSGDLSSKPIYGDDNPSVNHRSAKSILAQACDWRVRLGQISPELIEIAHASPKAEVGGLVLMDRYTQSQNISPSPFREMILDEENKGLVDDLIGDRAVFWHSHVNRSAPLLSTEDVALARQTGLPVWVYNTATGTQDYYDPLEPRPLENRPWNYAYSHCWDLARDYYWQVLGIKLRAHYMKSPAEVAMAGFTRFQAGLPQEGFSQVSAEAWKAGDRSPHDLILFKWATIQPSHIGVYVGNDTVLHQPFEERSRKSKLYNKYLDMIHSAWRRSESSLKVR